MLLLKNQALTFILLLGYIGLTLFYIQDKFYYLFDYMVYNLPLFKSTIVGFSNLELDLKPPSDLFLLPVWDSSSLRSSCSSGCRMLGRSHYPWLFLSFCMFLLMVTAGFRHVRSILWEGEMRALYTKY